MRTPLFVHLVFHPKSSAARELAQKLYAAWNADRHLAGLAVPTVLIPEDGTHFPPSSYPLDKAERNIVVVLADDTLVINSEDKDDGHPAWGQFVVDLYQQCEAPGCRFIPVQLSAAAWPLDDRLQTINFLRAFAQPEADMLTWLTRALLIEMCRFLSGQERGDTLPVTLFISHTKQDISKGARVFKAISEHLKNTTPIETWIDSAKVAPGRDFTSVIAAGVENTLMLVLNTDAYGSRSWCRKEMLLAKRLHRPLVIVEALEGVDGRGFPYGGNAPRMQWSEGGAQAAVDLLLKETLRHLHVTLVLARQKREGDVILPAPPELVTAIDLAENTAVLYPDFPLGDEEMASFKRLNLQIETPLQRAAKGDRLEQKRILLSLSESGDTERHGMTQAGLDAALIEISRQLLVRGAILEYGGNLGSEGYTIALFDMAMAYKGLSGLPAAARIINDVGWPLPLPDEVKAKYFGVATLKRIARPSGVEALDPAEFVAEPKFFPASSDKRRFAWARGMTTMREEQVKKSGAVARVMLGGKTGSTVTATPDGKKVERWYSGRIPGVVEEALLSLEGGQPLYLIGAFGGAAAMVIDLLEGRERKDFTWEHQSQAPFSEEMRQLYLQQGVEWQDYSEMTEFFRNFGVAGLAKANCLTLEENQELFWTRDVTRMVELILEGLTRLG